jgi:hypothetical protein
MMLDCAVMPKAPDVIAAVAAQDLTALRRA